MPVKQPETEKVVIPLDFMRGMWSSGDPAIMPDGYCRKLRNIYIRSKRGEQRPPFTYDNLTGIHSLAPWDDSTNKVQRLVSIDGSGNLKAKGVSGETWGAAATGAVSGSRLTSAATYNGVLYGMMQDANGLPSAAFSYDGSAVDTTPFNSSIFARCVMSFKERLFFLYPRVTVTPNVRVGVPFDRITAAYNWNEVGWAKTNVTATIVNTGTEYSIRLYPTSIAAGCSVECSQPVQAIITAGTWGMFDVPLSPTDTYYVWHQDIRPVHQTYRVPITMELVMASDLPAPGAAFVFGSFLTSTGFRHRCTTAGTTAGAAPAFNTVQGGTTTWGTAVFTNEGPDVLASLEFDLPNATEAAGQFLPYTLSVRVPWSAGTRAYGPLGTTGAYGIMPRLKMYNAATPLLTTIAPIDISRVDYAHADGSPLKRNYGCQITTGEFEYPFYNIDTSTTASATIDIDEWIWSEVAQPDRIRRANSLNTTGPAGYGTAVCVLGGRLVGFKRRHRQVLASTDSATNPVIPEGEWLQGGCIGPRALDVFVDSDGNETAFYVAEDSVYGWSYGSNPVDLCTDAVREEMMDKSASSWVESQTYNMPLVCVHPGLRAVFVYTQKGKIFVYFIDYKAWGVIDAGGGDSLTPVGYEVYDMAYHPVTDEIYVSFATSATGTAGLARLDPNVADALDQISSSGTLTVYKEIWTRPIELTAPRKKVYVSHARIQHKITTDQTGQTITAATSTNQGVSFGASNQVTLDPLSDGGYRPMRIVLRQGHGSLMLRILGAGKGGRNSFNISQIEVDAIIRGKERIFTNPTPGSASLT